VRRLRIAFVAASAALLAACGGGGAFVAAPPALPAGAVPTELAVGTGLSVTPNTTRAVIKAFKAAGPQSLAKEGRVWELRLGSQLVGVLQLTTLTGRVNTADHEDRQAVRSQILAGAETEFEVATTPVWTAKDHGRGTYVWFGRQLLCVLQVKSSQFESDDAATAMVTTMLESKDWPELPPEAFEEDL
jgi:hypothetical protein